MMTFTLGFIFPPKERGKVFILIPKNFSMDQNLADVSGRMLSTDILKVCIEHNGEGFYVQFYVCTFLKRKNTIQWGLLSIVYA